MVHCGRHTSLHHNVTSRAQYTAQRGRPTFSLRQTHGARGSRIPRAQLLCSFNVPKFGFDRRGLGWAAGASSGITGHRGPIQPTPLLGGGQASSIASVARTRSLDEFSQRYGPRLFFHLTGVSSSASSAEPGEEFTRLRGCQKAGFGLGGRKGWAVLFFPGNRAANGGLEEEWPGMAVGMHGSRSVSGGRTSKGVCSHGSR